MGWADRWVVVLLVGVLIGACATPAAPPAAEAPTAGAPAAAGAPASPPAPRAPFRLGYPNLSLSYLPILMAREAGYYEEEGLDADLQQMRANVGQAALVSGEIDFTAAVGSNLRMALQGAPIKTFLLLMQAQVMSLVARPEFQSVADLRGRRVGVGVAGASIDQVARLVVRHYGLEPQQDVQIVSVGDGAIQYEALKLGQIDAAMMSLPFPLLGRREGYAILANAHEIMKLPSAGVGALQSTLDQRRDMVRRVVRAQIRALQLVRAQPDAAIRFIAEFFDMDPETARESYEYILPAWSAWGEVDREAIELQIQLDKAGGLVSSLTYDDIVDPSIVAEVARELGLR